MPSHLDLLTRIAVGGLLGSLIGLERNRHSRHVVLRTHILVSVASASYMVVSIYFAYFQDFGPKMLIEVDGSRIAASVVSGIGFLAGGVILKSGATVQGLTTAASLWLATAVGLLSGSAMYSESAFVAAIGVATLSLLRKFEEKKEKTLHRKVALVINDEQNAMITMMDLIRGLGVKVSNLNYDRTLKSHTIEVKFTANIPVEVGVTQLIATIEAQPGVKQVKVKATD